MPVNPGSIKYDSEAMRIDLDRGRTEANLRTVEKFVTTQYSTRYALFLQGALYCTG